MEETDHPSEPKLYLAAPGPVTAPRPTLPRSQAYAALLCPPVEPARRPSELTPKTRPSFLGLATRRRQRVLFVCLGGGFVCINKENLQASYLTPLALFYFKFTESLVRLFCLTTSQQVGSLFLKQGSNLCPLQWKQGILTTGQGGKSMTDFTCSVNCSNYFQLKAWYKLIQGEMDG